MLDPPTYPLASIWHKLDMWVTPKTNRPIFCPILKLSRALDGLFSVLSWLHDCVFFAEWRITKCDFFQILLLGIFFWYGNHYLFSEDTDAVMTTFHTLVNTYFLNFRLALLIALRALVHLIYIVIFNNFLVSSFSFFNFEQ